MTADAAMWVYNTNLVFFWVLFSKTKFHDPPLYTSSIFIECGKNSDLTRSVKQFRFRKLEPSNSGGAFSIIKFFVFLIISHVREISSLLLILFYD